MVDGMNLEENQFVFTVYYILELQNIVWQSALNEAFHIVPGV